MTQMVEIRVRTKIHPDELEAKKGKVLDESDLNVVLTGPAKVYKPDGKLLAQYLPGYFEGLGESDFYPILHRLRAQQTDNRGLAAGTGRVLRTEASQRTRTQVVPSAIIGAFDPNPTRRYCRLTAWTGRETEEFSGLWPLFGQISDAFAENVPDRFQQQMAYVRRTEDDWVVPGTPFTTITINNSYPTGVHTDKGDLDAGFSNLTVLRRGDYRGGIFTFPEYRVGVDMKDGDLLLMDAHEWHGNTAMWCNGCDRRIGPPEGLRQHDECYTPTFVGHNHPERISIVCYYRTKMADCGSAEEEAQKALAFHEARVDKRAVEEMAEEAVG